jgi:hypothetical protein
MSVGLRRLRSESLRLHAQVDQVELLEFAVPSGGQDIRVVLGGFELAFELGLLSVGCGCPLLGQAEPVQPARAKASATVFSGLHLFEHDERRGASTVVPAAGVKHRSKPIYESSSPG